MPKKEYIQVRCQDGWHRVQAVTYACGLAYHFSLGSSQYVVTHLASGKSVLKKGFEEQYQARYWIMLLNQVCDWWFLDIDPSLETAVHRTWKRAAKQRRK